MPEIYDVQWIDLEIAENQKLPVAVCGYSNKVRHIGITNADELKKSITSNAITDDDKCTSNKQCLALDCPYNCTETANILQMFNMTEDQEVDAETAKAWNCNTLSGCYVAMAKCISEDYLS